MVARDSASLRPTRRADTNHSLTMPRPVGAFVPVAWRVIVVLRAVPAGPGHPKPATAFVGTIEHARTALDIIKFWAGPALTAYIVNEDAASPKERADWWESAGWLADQIQDAWIAKIVTGVRVRAKTEWGTGPEFSFTVPYGLALRILGQYRLKSSMHLAKPLTTFYSHVFEDVMKDRFAFIDYLKSEVGV